MSALVLLIGAIALVVHWLFKCTRCCLSYEQNPLRFQIEFLLLLFWFLCTIAIVMIVSRTIVEYTTIVEIVLVTIGNLIILPGYSLFLSCLYARGKLNQTCSKEGLTEALTNESKCQALMQFAIRELSVENVLCYKAICQFKMQPTTLAAQSIVQTYLERSAALEVNVTDAQKQHIAKLMLESDGNIVMPTLFDGIETSVCENLMDTYGRFLQANKATSSV